MEFRGEQEAFPNGIHSHPTGSEELRQKKSLEAGQTSSQEEDEYDLNNQAEVIFHSGPDL